MKKNKLLLILVIALIVSVCAYFYFKKKERATLAGNIVSQPGEQPSPAAPQNNAVPAAAPQALGKFPVMFGSRGKTVQMLQVIAGIKPDGIWGALTDAAIRRALPAFDGNITQAQFYGHTTTGFGQTTAADWPLRSGSNNNYVKAVQIMLGLSVDGKFGKNTGAAVSKIFGHPTVSPAEFNTLVKTTFLI